MSPRRLFLPLLAASCLATSLTPIPAIAGELLSENDFLSELPVVLSATRLRQSLADTPASMTVIDRQMIVDAGAWDVADLFRLVPGMYVAYNVDKEVVPGHVVSYHGMADPYAKRMQILIDGRSVYTPLFGGPIWSNIPLALDDIERIEVVRGPNAASYGANSFLGVINIITRDPATVQGKLVSLTAGNVGTDATLRYGGRAGAMDYRTTLQLRGDNGYTRDSDGRYNNTDVHSRTDNKRIGNLSFRGDYRPNSGDEVQLQFGYSGGGRGTGDFPGAYTNSNPRREKDVGSLFALARWQRDLGADSQFSLRAYYNRERLSEDTSQLVGPTLYAPFTLSVPTPFDRPLNHIAERSDLEAQHSFWAADSLRVVWGGGLRLDRVRSLLYLGSDDFKSFSQQNVFANAEWRPFAPLVFNFGAMVEHNSFVGTNNSPRISLNYHLTPSQTLRATLSRAWRNPVPYEQQSNSRWIYTSITPVAGVTLPLQYLYGQNNLRPERIDSRELGYLLELPRGGSLDLKYSYDTLTDLIEMYQFDCCNTFPPLAGTVRTFGNRSDASIHSFEAQWQQQLDEVTRIHFGWSSTHIVRDSGAFPASDGYAYDRTASRHGQNLLLARQLTPVWRASLGVYHVGSIQANANGKDSLSPYTRWDVRIARQFKWREGEGELALVVQNLGDTQYREFYADNVWGQRAFVNLRLAY
jgi:iron complex outermembrane receptor protein